MNDEEYKKLNEMRKDVAFEMVTLLSELGYIDDYYLKEIMQDMRLWDHFN